ncbi:MAG: hypothetical protein JO327_11385 [Nitrososphaeraceae archaeon]|nr:hypothetical protein [Nitrososphaeraceae archaeon]MBV9668717.1 hypothetical protein [Nitrososphaeraceae archaeon]
MSHSLKKFYAHAANLSVISLLVVGTLVPSIMKFSYAANIGVFTADSKPYGKTYGEWTAEWWKWLLSIPKPDNPAADTTGKNCALKQTGTVWFLTGTYGGTNERTCTIPAGKAILINIIDVICSYAEHHLKTEPELRACAKADQDKVTTTSLTVDGAQINPVRLQSPLFTVTLPPNNALGLQPQTTPAISDGYWVFLQPLPPGSHTIHSSGSLVDFTTTGTTNFASEAIYHITIK